MEYTVKNEDELAGIASVIHGSVKRGDIVVFDGELGAGKTALIKRICKLYGIESNKVKSPSFSIHNVYLGPEIIVNHYDLYRLSDIEDLSMLNIFENIENSITLIEWGGRFIEYFYENCRLIITIRYIENLNEGRRVYIRKGGKEG